MGVFIKYLMRGMASAYAQTSGGISVSLRTKSRRAGGEFAAGYSGADHKATSYYYVCDVLSIEKTGMLMF